jgi:hypothetical protein
MLDLHNLNRLGLYMKGNTQGVGHSQNKHPQGRAKGLLFGEQPPPRAFVTPCKPPHQKKNYSCFCLWYLMGIQQVPAGYHGGENRKTMWHILKTGMPTLVGVSFSKMPCEFLCSVTWPANWLEFFAQCFMSNRSKPNCVRVYEFGNWEGLGRVRGGCKLGQTE